MLQVSECFYSIQGESTQAGRPCMFIRLSGCNLRCEYCDTLYAQDNGTPKSIDNVVALVEKYPTRMVEITGGEPLIQKDTPKLAHALLKRGFQVMVETNGTQNIQLLPRTVQKIMDIKCPGASATHPTDWRNIERLTADDEVKFVLTGNEDYLWAKDVIHAYHLTDRLPVLLSPANGYLAPEQLADWILADGLNVRLQLQLHKILWPEAERGR